MRGSHPFQVRQVEGIKLAKGEGLYPVLGVVGSGPFSVEAESGCEPGFCRTAACVTLAKSPVSLRLGLLWGRKGEFVGLGFLGQGYRLQS